MYLVILYMEKSKIKVTTEPVSASLNLKSWEHDNKYELNLIVGVLYNISKSQTDMYSICFSYGTSEEKAVYLHIK